MTATLRVALGEYDTGWHDPTRSLARVADLARASHANGAELLVLPEMCTTGFTMDAAARAEPIDGPSVARLRAIASAERVALLAGVALRETCAGEGRMVNAAILIGADGEIDTIYRKQRVFGYAGEDEVYAEGTEPVISSVRGVRIAPFVCYDLRFPELFRRVARDVDAVVVIANWPARRRAHWDALLRARAIENQCWVVGVNRTGHAAGIEYDGGSAAYDPWGQPVTAGGGLAVVTVDAARVAAVREEFPFLDDYRG